MKKVLIAAAAAAMIVSSCGSKGNTNSEIAAESKTDSLSATCNGTLCGSRTLTYEGVLPGADVSGIHYLLTLKETSRGSLGTYNLTTTYLGADNGKDKAFTDSGTVTTIAGIPNDSTAIVYQLVSAAPHREKTNFLAEGDSALTMIGQEFEKAVSGLNYTLKKKR